MKKASGKMVQARIDDLIRGKRLLIVGGDPRPHHIRRIQMTLGFSAVEWIETRSSDPLGRKAVGAVEQSRADIVIVLIGLVRHAHAKRLSAACKESGTLLVRYRGKSPHPNGLRDAIESQAARRLHLSEPNS